VSFRAEPSEQHAPWGSVRELVRILTGRRFAVLTGAGVSTESGIPDYRSPDAAARGERRPIHGPEFVRSAPLRRRYWARAMAGWERFRLAQPGPSHHAIAELEQKRLLSGLITQNVDRLHHAAGSRTVIELHGALAEVVCLDCGALDDRDAVQARLREQNPEWLGGASGQPRMAPDGDAELPDELVERFVGPVCVQCGGVLKPNVVFFGHNVARPIVDAAYDVVARAEALLVAGTSLAVFSGYRFLVRAAERGIPIVIVNRGPVRGEERATLKVEESTGETLTALARELGRL
jgi:NAD-dependent SIR2 family protein deacetylase